MCLIWSFCETLDQFIQTSCNVNTVLSYWNYIYNGYILCSLWMYKQMQKRIWNFIPQACVYMNGINGYGFKTRKVNWMCDIFNLKMSHIQFITIKQIPSEEWNITGSMDKSNSKEGLGHQENMTTSAVNIFLQNCSRKNLDWHLVVLSQMQFQISSQAFHHTCKFQKSWPKNHQGSVCHKLLLQILNWVLQK